MTTEIEKLMTEHFRLTQAFKQYDTAYLLLTYFTLYDAKERLNQLEDLLNSKFDADRKRILNKAGYQVTIEEMENGLSYSIHLNEHVIELSKNDFIDFWKTITTYDTRITLSEQAHDVDQIFSYQQELETYLLRHVTKKED